MSGIEKPNGLISCYKYLSYLVVFLGSREKISDIFSFGANVDWFICQEMRRKST